MQRAGTQNTGSVPLSLSTTVLESLDLWRKRIDYSVDSSPRALHSAVRDVLRCNRRVLRDVSRRADRSGLNAVKTNGQSDNG